VIMRRRQRDGGQKPIVTLTVTLNSRLRVQPSRGLKTLLGGFRIEIWGSDLAGD
jgi:hypothetical protein